MINHARTLLLNVSATNPYRPSIGVVGEEFIPKEFNKLSLPAALIKARSVLFGTAEDPLYQNIQAAKYMSILLSVPVAEEYIKSLDPRITHPVTGYGFSSFTFGSFVEHLSSKGMNLETIGRGRADNRTGRCWFSWQVSTQDTSSIKVVSFWNGASSVYAVELTNNLSQLIPLEDGTSLRLTVPTGGWEPNAFWSVTSYYKPEETLGQTVLRLERIGTEAATYIFKDAPNNFYNMWTKAPDLPTRLSGILSALIYQIERVRNA